MDKTIISSPEHCEIEKNAIKFKIEEIFKEAREKGVEILVPGLGFARLNETTFDYWHKDEIAIVNYKV